MNIPDPFKKVLPSGLRAQLIIGIALIIGVSISLFVLDQINRQKAFFLKLNHERGVGLSENLANIATFHVAAYELDGLQNLLKTYKKMPGLEYAMITSPDGIVLAHTNNKYLGLKPDDSVSIKLKPIKTTQVLLENNQIFDVASPIFNQNEIIGWARIGVSQKFIEPNISEIKRKGVIYILIGLVIGILFAAIVGGRLSKGLQKLVEVAQKIREGERDLRVAPTKSMEVTQLGIAFNKMLDDISSNERLLSRVLENMPVGVFILDKNGKVLSLNPAAQKIWEGAKYVNKEGYNVYKGWFPDTGKEIESHEWGAAVALNENRPVLNQEAEIEGFNGTRKTILNSCIPLHGANQNIVGLISIIVDITERKKAELAIKESEVKYRYLFNNNPAFVIIWDLQTLKVKEVNDIVVAKYGYSKEEWIDMSVLRYRPVEDHEKIKAFAQSMLMEENRPMTQMAWKHIKKNGEEMHMEISSHKIIYNDRPCILSLGTDITERKKAEEELLKKNHDIGERVKELNCLYRMSELSNNPRMTMHDILQDCVDVIPPSYQYPEITCARIEFEGNIFESADFMETGWKQEQNIMSKDAVIGNVQVYYKEKMPDEKEGPFLAEERFLINSIADLLGSSAERRRAEEKLRISAERYKSIITVSNTGAWEYNMDSGFLWCSPEYFTMLGRRKEDYDFSGITNLEETWVSLLHPEDRDRASNNFENYLMNGSVGMYESYFRMKHKNGNWIWIWSRGQTLRDSNGIPTNITIGTHIDITEQKKAEQQISLEKLLSDSIINSLPGIFYMRDKDGHLVRWNKNTELFFGPDKKKAGTLNTLDFVDDSQKGLVIKSHQESNQKGVSEIIVSLKNKEGKSIPHFFTSRKLNFEGDEFVIAIGIDISERIEAENKLIERALEIQKLSAHLEHAQEEERTRIAREIHDELGQQLTGLKMDAFIVAKNIEANKTKAIEKVNEMVSLIDFTIKTVRRISSDLRPGVLDDLGLMSALEWQGEEFEKRSGVKLVFQSDLPDLNPDRNLSTGVFRVYQEILTNIMRHAKATLVETKLDVVDNNIILEVKDNGQGFDPEEVKNKGSLGLVGMKERVLLFNGELTIDSKKNFGTVVNLKAPLIYNKNYNRLL